MKHEKVNFSPSRFSQLKNCKWSYYLQRMEYLYPRDKVIEKHSQLGSAMHHFAENYTSNCDKQKLHEECLNKYVLEDSQIDELLHMENTLIDNIFPILSGDTGEFEVEEYFNELNMTNNLIIDMDEEEKYSVGLNLKIDRLIKTKDGRVIILDYKKGKPSIQKHMFQLLFYANAYSQHYRVPFNKIELWLVFPNEKKDWIQRISGSDLIDELPDFRKELSRLLKEHQDVKTNGAVPEDANPSFLCNFCDYNATDFCPMTLMLSGNKFPKNVERVFTSTQYVNGTRVQKIIKPKEIISSSKANLW